MKRAFSTLSVILLGIGVIRVAAQVNPYKEGTPGVTGFRSEVMAEVIVQEDKFTRLAEAEAAYRKTMELAPQREVARAVLSLNLLAQGRGDEALAEVSREPNEAYRLWALAIIEDAAGRRTESDVALQNLIAKYQTECAYQVADVYGARGYADLAFDWLERAYVQRDAGLADTKTDGHLRSLYADPRWDAFLRKMGLAD